MAPDLSSAALRRFIESSPIPMTLGAYTVPDCPVIIANDAFLELTGYARDDVIGRNCRFLQGPKTDAGARAKLRQAVQDCTEVMVPIVNYRHDGTPFENLVFLFPILTTSGKPLFMMGSQYDITSQRREVSLGEHAQMLDDAILRSNVDLRGSLNLTIRAPEPCTKAVQGLLR